MPLLLYCAHILYILSARQSHIAVHVHTAAAVALCPSLLTRRIMRRTLASCVSSFCSHTARTAAALPPLSQQHVAFSSLTASRPSLASVSTPPQVLRSRCGQPACPATRVPALPAFAPSSLSAQELLSACFPSSVVWSPVPEPVPASAPVECAVPKRKPSPRAQRHRRAGQRATGLTRRYVNYRVCLNCGAAVKPHFLCNRCRTVVARF